MAFDQKTRTSALLWCDRHCCLCKKPCGTNIEVHHIVPEGLGGSDEIDNAIALCFECHGEVGRYNESHPVGSKYRPEELKARRDQIYEEFTRHLVPPIYYNITNQLLPNGKREYPDVGFSLVHYGDSLPVRVQSVIEAIQEALPAIKMPGHYGGEVLWNLNPRLKCSGHFRLPDAVGKLEKIRLRVSLRIFDQYDRPHDLLPVHFLYVRDGDYWYFDA